MTGPPAIHGPAPPDAAGRPFISVIVPSYNRRDSLVTVLDALGRQTYPVDDFEIIVVLDGSTDGSGELLEQLIRERPARAGEEHKNNGEHCKDGEHDRNGGDKQLKFLWQPNQGAGRARNHGAATARGDLLVFLDDDVVPHAGLLAAHARAHQEAPGLVVLGRLLFCPHVPRSVIVEWEAEWYTRHFADIAQPDYSFGCWDLFAGNFSLARTDFAAVGGFDESFTTYGCEDWELGMRLLRTGLRFRYCQDASGEHRYNLDVHGWLHHAYWDGRSEVRFARKYPEIKHALQLAPFYRGSWKRRLGRRLLEVAPRAWTRLLPRAAPLYLWAERHRRRRLAARLAKLMWTVQYWSGLCDALGGPGAVDAFIGFRVPVLVYHRVTEHPHPALEELAVSPATFRRQLAWLRGRGHTAITLSQLYEAYRGAAPLPPRPVLITFDDGYEDTATVAAPILREFGLPASVFIVADYVGRTNSWDAALGPPAAHLMSWEQIRELASSGMEIGGHSATHATLTALTEPELTREIRASRATIERHLDQPVRWFAYPYGEHDAVVRRATQSADYGAALAYGGGLAAAGDDLFQLNRFPVYEEDIGLRLAFKLATGSDWWTAVKSAVKARLPAPLQGAWGGTPHKNE